MNKKCEECNQGYYKLSDAQSSEWKKVYRCSFCRYQIDKKTFIAKISSFISLFASFAALVSYILKIFIDIEDGGIGGSEI